LFAKGKFFQGYTISFTGSESVALSCKRQVFQGYTLSPLGRGKGEGVMNGRSNNLRKTKLLLAMKI